MTSSTHRLEGHLRATKLLFVVLLFVMVSTLIVGANWAADRHLLSFLTGIPEDLHVAPQETAPTPDLTTTELARYRTFAGAPVADPAPLVLAYHDVNADPKGPYALRPQQFEDHMAMLEVAGFHTITAQQLAAWQQGKPLPPRSVFLTFDDGTAGLWKYADPILAQHGFRAATFVITGDLAARTGGYYLSWAELERLAATGRWDVESHSHDGHRDVPIEAQGATGAFFVNREWLPEQQRLETLDEYRARIATDLDKVQAQLVDRGLPRAQYFAQPRSATVKDANDPAVIPILQGVLAERYLGAFTNADTASQLGPSDLAARVLPRVELVGNDSATEAFDKIERAMAGPVTDHRPFDRPELWIRDDGKPAAGFAPGRLTLPAGNRRWIAAHHAPGATARWGSYRLSVAIEGLTGASAVESAGISVFDGSAGETIVGVSQGYVSVRRGPAGANAKVGEAAIVPAPSHDVAIEADAGSVVVTVDGKEVYSGGDRDPTITGGVALSLWRTDPSLSPPTFVDLHVSPR